MFYFTLGCLFQFILTFQKDSLTGDNWRIPLKQTSFVKRLISWIHFTTDSSPADPGTPRSFFSFSWRVGVQMATRKKTCFFLFFPSTS